MLLVVDANVAFSAIIADGLTRRLLLDERLTLRAPQRLLTELERHWPIISRKARQDAEAVLEAMLARIGIVDVWVQETFLPDPDDSSYISLARQLGCPLWTQDKAHADVWVMGTAELARLLR